jgi:dihydroxyacetone kinase-like protein
LAAITRADFSRWLMIFANLIAANKDYLTELDSAIGDADHGINMERGFQAVLLKLPSLADQDIGSICKAVGMTLVSTVGGASGPLYGTFFIQLGVATAGKHELALPDWAAALEAGVEGVAKRGKAVPGDKTMLDSLLPALAALKAAAAQGAALSDALSQSEQAAQQGMLATIPLVARKGRASYLGERSADHQDPGATSAHLLLQAAAEAWSAL